MILAIVFANVWSVIQLIVLGSIARTIRVRTVLAAMAVGLYACAPLTAILQVAWTQDRALEAEADALEAIQRRPKAQRAADAANIAAATADPDTDPAVAAARCRCAGRHQRMEAAQILMAIGTL